MNYSTTYAKISLANQPESWRKILVVSVEEPISFPTPDVVRNKQDLGNRTVMESIFYTTGSIFKQFEQDGKYYYWFIITREETQTYPSTEYLNEAVNALTVLGVDVNG